MVAALIGALFIRAASAAAPPRVHTVPVLMYHMLGNGPGDGADRDCEKAGGCRRRADHCPAPGGAAAGPEMIIGHDEFVWELDYLKERRYRTLTLEEAFGDKRVPLEPTDVVITFDDGYADNLDAFALLKERGLKANLFMVSNNVDCQGRLSADELRRMDADGFRVYAHSKTHDAARTAGPERDQLEEYGESKTALEAVLGRAVDFVAYPYGRFTADTPGVAARLGYRGAFEIGERLADRDGDRFLLSRFRVSSRAEFLRALCAGLSKALGEDAAACAVKPAGTKER